MIKLNFSRKLRLLSAKQFAFIFDKPQRVSVTYFTILGRANMLLHPRIGLSISKKSVKLSHERNRIKRLIRESFRLRQHTLPAMDFVVIAKTDVSTLSNYNLTEILNTLWRFHFYQDQNY